MTDKPTIALEFSEPPRFLVASECMLEGKGAGGASLCRVAPDLRAGDAILCRRSEGFVLAAHAISDAGEASDGHEAKYDPDEAWQFQPSVTLDQLRNSPYFTNLSPAIRDETFERLAGSDPTLVEGELGDALLHLLASENPGFIEWFDPRPRVWFTAGDPKKNRRASDLEPGEIVQWAVPPDCRHGDYVFFWLNGTGFSYLFRTVGRAWPAREGEFGPYQSWHRVVARFAEPIMITELGEHPVLKDWPLVRSKMQAPARNQTKDFREELRYWAAFTSLLTRHNPELEPLVDRLRPNLLKAILPGYAHDVPTGRVDDDLLDLQAEYRTLASLLAARVVQPPLAVGLFGEWGSGKSFFIQQVKREVAEIATMATGQQKADPDADIAFHRDVYQIEFNAWHYSGGDLWASLVDHLFTALRDELRCRRGDNEAERKKADEELQTLLDELETTERAERAAEEQIAQLKQQAQNADRNAKRLHDDLAKQQKELSEARHADLWRDVTMDVIEQKVRDDLVTQANQHGYPNLASDVHQLVALGRRVGAVGHRGEAVWRSLRHDGLKPWKPVFLIGVLLAALVAGPVMLALISLLVPRLAGSLVPVVTQALVLICGVVKWSAGRKDWLDTKLKDVEAFLDTVEGAASQVEAKLRDEQRKRDDAIATAEAEIARLGAELDAAQRVRAEAQRQQVELVARIETRLPERRLADFIEDRANCQDYREKIGVMALIRRDFERLSDLLALQSQPDSLREAARRQIKRKKPDRPLPAIDRIVLYIDDLDRCGQSKVVEVLRAVHLLMAYELFIVVVAVDARWLSRSLELEHDQLLLKDHSLGKWPDQPPERQAGAKATSAPPPRTTAVDYLEKIFQIPYWLPDFTGVASQRMMYGLLGRKGPDAPGGQDPPPEIKRIIAPPDKRGDASERSTHEQPARRPRVLPKDRDPSPEGLRITDVELRAVIQVAPLAGATPRQIKRFTNLYRLLKIGLGERELDAFLGRTGDAPGFVPASVLLAIVTGAPKAVTVLFHAIDVVGAKEPERTLEKLADDVLWKAPGNGHSEDDPLKEVRAVVSRSPEVEPAARKLLAVTRQLTPITLKQLRPWLAWVAHYSFAGDWAPRVPLP